MQKLKEEDGYVSSYDPLFLSIRLQAPRIQASDRCHLAPLEFNKGMIYRERRAIGFSCQHHCFWVH